ncbi:NAD(P)-dependent oxidoreductase [Rhodococcus sp. 15-649-1-2]|nr:NAD(P)-dependent oxidoreductase [Rhodococcus sp. 15-649-1-2]
MRIGFVGVGRMGAPMVGRLAAMGQTVRVHARSDRARAGIEASGDVLTVDTAAATAVNADAVVVCVHDDEQVRQVCHDGGLLTAMLPGSVLIVHTTGHPRTVRDMAEVLAQRGVSIVDAPVSGGPEDIVDGRITTFVGGSDDAVAAARTVLDHYSNPSFHTGVLGTGQLTKLVNNAVFASNTAVLGAAIGIGRGLGIEEEVLLQCLQRGSASSMVLDTVRGTGGFENFDRAVGEFVTKDIAVVRRVATELDVELGLLDSTLTR